MTQFEHLRSGIDAGNLTDDGSVNRVFIERESQGCFAFGEAAFAGVFDGQVVAGDRINDDTVGGKLIELPICDQP